MAHEYSKEVQDKIVAIIQMMMEEAGEDKEFKKLSLTDFPAAFRKLTGHGLPEGASFKFVEASVGSEYPVMLELPDVDSEELSDDDLEKVAGGIGDTLSSFNNAGIPVAVAYGAPIDWQNIDFGP